MKKSVALIIALVYLASIVFIAFFGMKLATLNPPIYVQSITCTNDELFIDENGEKWLVIVYEEGLVFTIEYEILPQDASNQWVDFTYPKSDSYDVTLWGEIVFYEPEPFKITIRATDGSGVMETVRILLRRA